MQCRVTVGGIHVIACSGRRSEWNEYLGDPEIRVMALNVSEMSERS